METHGQERSGDYEQALELIDSVYEAALDVDEWPRFLDRLCSFMGAIAADFYVRSGEANTFAAFTGISDDLMREYLAHYHDQNQRVSALQNTRQGGLITDFDLLSPEEISRSPYYQDLIFRNGYGLCIGGTPLQTQNQTAMFGVHFARGVNGYHDDNFRKLKLVMPHMRRAVQVRNRLNDETSRVERISACIDSLSTGVVLLDGRYRVSRVNDAAGGLLGRACSSRMAN
ncbi:MAG: hypothetical protein U9R74_20525 [Pseudomonadota bacterium]|nr:hypothetical protein [Pseudomonadota bacterium]